VKAKQRRFTKRLILEAAWRDKEKAESVCRSDVVTFDRDLEKAVEFKPGDVLADSRGQGCLQ